MGRSCSRPVSPVDSWTGDDRVSYNVGSNSGFVKQGPFRVGCEVDMRLAIIRCIRIFGGPLTSLLRIRALWDTWGIV